MIIVLLRQYLLPWIELFVRRSDRTAIWLNSQRAEASELNRFLNLTITWQTQDAKSWCIGGRQLDVPINHDAASYDPVAMQRSYSWNIIPWGADFTGLMVAFVSSDERLLDEANLELEKLGCGDLVVNRYTASDVLNGKFRGLVFGRLKDDRGKGVWPYICGNNASVLAFSRGSLPRALMESSEIVGTEDSSSIYGKGLCLRIKREDDFLELAIRNIELLVSDDSEGCFAASGLEHFDSLQRDPIAFAIKEFGAAKVIYVPGTARRHEEIILCQSDSDANQIGNSKQLKGSSMFELTCYC